MISDIFGQGTRQVLITSGLNYVGQGIQISFDNGKLVIAGDSFQLFYNNVGAAINFYQQNLTTGIFGQNPFIGQRIQSNFINVMNHKATGYFWVNHLNIIEFAKKNYDYGFLKY